MTISTQKELDRKKNYYAENAEKIKEKRRQRYASQKEKQLNEGEEDEKE